MATLRERLIARRLARQKSSSSSLGPIYVKPEEVRKLSPEAKKDAVVVSGTTSNPIYRDVSGRKVTSSGGSSSRVKQAQEELKRLQEQQRQEELRKQQELKRLEEQNKRLQAERLRQQIQRERQIANKKLMEKGEQVREEKKRLQTPSNLPIQEELRRERERQLRQTAGISVPSKEVMDDIKKAENELINFANNLQNSLQNQVDSGTITVSQANNQLEKSINEKSNQINNRLEKKYPGPEFNWELKKPSKDKITLINKLIGKIQEKESKIDLERQNLRKEIKEISIPEYSEKYNRRFKTREEIKNEIRRKTKQWKLLNLALGKTITSNLVGALFITDLLTNKTSRTLAKKAIKNIIVDKNLRNELKKDILKEGDKFYNLVKVSPGEAFIQVGGEIYITRGIGQSFKIVGKATRKQINKLLLLDPRLLKVERGFINLKKALPSGEKLALKTGTIADVSESLAKQLRREGKSVVAVTAQADKLVPLIGKKIIRKPFPFDEKNLSKVTRDLLKKFDKGNLDAKKIIELNLRLRRETKRLGVQQKGIDLLERSTYFDPDRTLRLSRLKAGVEAVPEEGTLFDLLSGRATLFNKRVKPQIIVLEELVEKLPRTKEFQSIIRKLKASVKAGKDPNLTKSELAKLTRWQVTPSGKLKPIGSTTYQGGLERELTLSPGEAIKRVKKLGTLKYKNTRIPIYAVKIIKDKNLVRRLKKIEILEKNIKRTKPGSKTRKAREKQLERLETKQVKEFLKDARRRSPKRKKVFPARRKITSRAVTSVRKRRTPRSRTRRKTPRTRRITRPTPRRVTRPKRPRPRRPTPRIPTPRKVTRPRPRPRRVTTGGTPRVPLRRPRTKGRKKDLDRGKVKGYNVFVKSGGKFIKANIRPLSEINAQNRAAYIVDHSTAATAKIRPARTVKKVGQIKPREVGARTKVKARDYKIVRGKKVPLLDTIIEKRGKPRINTRGEKRGLTAARLVKQLNQPKKKKKTTRKKKR